MLVLLITILLVNLVNLFVLCLVLVAQHFDLRLTRFRKNIPNIFKTALVLVVNQVPSAHFRDNRLYRIVNVLYVDGSAHALEHANLLTDLHTSHIFELLFRHHEHEPYAGRQLEYLFNQERVDEIDEWATCVL